jgi:16S rRNA (cytidine1402-2'-O)-methyltransferase
VGTPIGNLDDLSYRQAKTIAESAILLTEDTRSTGFLLQRIQQMFQITITENQRLISYYKEKEFEKLPEILDLIEEDHQIALISQAGMPLISDPGYLLVKTLSDRNIPFTVIPGPTAWSTALVYSGFNPGMSTFMGFLPKKTGEKTKVIKKMQSIKTIEKDMNFVCYESPERIHDTLQSLIDTWPTAKVCVARELTKKFEEIRRGSPSELLQYSYKGEITIVIA